MTKQSDDYGRYADEALYCAREAIDAAEVLSFIDLACTWRRAAAAEDYAASLTAPRSDEPSCRR